MHVTRADLIPALLLGAVLLTRLFVAPATGTALWGQPDTTERLALAAGALVVTGLLIRRRRRPVLTLAAVLLLCLAWIPAGYPGPGAIAPIGLALYTVATGSSLARTLGVGAAALAPTLAVTAWLIGRGGDPGEAVTSALILALAGALGVAVRNQRLAREEATARVRQEERARVAALHRDWTEQRMALARDLHDTIGHNMAIISVQTAAAHRLVDRDADRARTSLELARQASNAVLEELAGALDLLRSDPAGPVTAGSPPSAHDLPELVRQARNAGVEADLEQPVPALGPDAAAAVYRIVQEALTNARRHAPGAPVRVQVRDVDGGVQVQVGNGPAVGPAQPERGAGRGLAGMRERAATLGGTVEAGPTGDGGYRVLARLPAAREGGR